MLYKSLERKSRITRPWKDTKGESLDPCLSQLVGDDYEPRLSGAC